MRVIVTGATGNVGDALLNVLETEPRISEIVGLARRLPERRRDRVEYHATDIARDDITPYLLGADAVVHLAWQFQPTHRPRSTWTANVEGSRRVFAAAAAAGVGVLVHASSVGAYSPGPSDGRPVDESWPTDSLPTAAYGREKAYVERLLDTFEYDHPAIRAVRMRPAFLFRRSAATEQRRLFAGPLVPNRLVAPGRLPLLPHPRGLRMQALHTADAAEAYRLALVSEVAGPFNIAADPVLDGAALAEILDARPLPLPARLFRAALAAGWHSRLVPADPNLFDLFLQLPTMDTTRARHELGWAPRRKAHDAVTELVLGMAGGSGGPTPPLEDEDARSRATELPAGHARHS